MTSGTAKGTKLHGDSLGTWREAKLMLRSRNRPSTSNSQENQAVWLGWNNRVAGANPDSLGEPASYTIRLPRTLAGEWNLNENTTLDFLLAPTKTKPGPAKRRAIARTSVRRLLRAPNLPNLVVVKKKKKKKKKKRSSASI